MKGVTGTAARYFRAENHFPALERKDHEKTYQSTHVCPQVAPGVHVWLEDERENAERRYSVVILFQVRDLAAKTCGEPHVAPSWGIAKASLGAMLAKTPELAERAHAIWIEYLGDFDPETGYEPEGLCSWEGNSSSGDVCLAEFRAACAKEEHDMQAEADHGWSVPEFTNERRVFGPDSDNDDFNCSGVEV